MTALVTKHLPLVAGAPDGVKKLRDLVLELAVCGRLLAQDESDEPADLLIDRIEALKASQISSRAVKRQKAATQPTVQPNHAIPESWRFVQLGDVVEIVRGITFPASEKSKEPSPGRIACLRTANVQSQIEWDDLLYIDEGFVSREDQFLQPNDIVMSMANSRELVGKVALVGEESLQRSTFGGFLGVLRPYLIEPRFVMALLRTPSARSALIDSASQTTNIANISLAKLRPLMVALPPLAEQHRIVAKVDELMALCDRLEADQADAEAAHAQLVQALLDSLTQATDAADFRASWQRLSEHFHTVFTTEACIDALKQTVLQLAVMGKLVPQASDDEPAVDLLSRIAKANTAKRRASPLGDPSPSPKPYELPSGWCWTTLPEVGELARGKSKHRPRNDPALYSGGTIPLVQTGDVARANGVIYTSTGRYNDTGLAQSRLWPRGTMCITIAANIADSAILGFDACFPDSVVGFIPGLPELDVRYFEFFLRTAKADLQKFAPSTAQKNINLEILGSIYLPLPPAAELTRIVAKVDEFLVLCDQLKARLAECRQLHGQLATALVGQAVA